VDSERAERRAYVEQLRKDSQCLRALSRQLRATSALIATHARLMQCLASSAFDVVSRPALQTALPLQRMREPLQPSPWS
jgi:hypothetical protein